MPSKQLKEFLDRNGVKYVTLTHSPAYTSQEIAASAHITGKKMAKTVIVKVDGKLAMAVLPAHERVTLEHLKATTGSRQAELARPEELEGKFPDSEQGAMPPFGNLYGVDVFVSPDLRKQDEIAFNAGNFHELIVMPYADFERLVKPKVLDFADVM